MPLLRKAVDSDDVCHCVIRKNPYSWYASYSYYCRRSITPVQPHDIKRWADLNRHWLHCETERPGKTLFLKYEDLLEHTEEGLNRVAAQFGLKRTEQRRLVSLEKISNWGGRPSKEPFDRSYYHEERSVSYTHLTLPTILLV